MISKTIKFISTKRASYYNSILQNSLLIVSIAPKIYSIVFAFYTP